MGIKTHRKLWDQLRKEMQDAGFSSGQIIYARQITNEYNSDYVRDYQIWKHTSNSETLNPDALNPFSDDEYLNELDTSQMNDIYDKIKYLKDKVEQNADVRKIALVNHEPTRPKISTESDENPGYTLEWHKADRGIPIIQETEKLQTAVRDEIFSSPAHGATKEQHEDIAAKIDSFNNMLETYNKFLRSCVDKKYSFTLWQHAQMRSDIDTVSKHGAGKKASIQAMRAGKLVDEWRKMTREQASDEAEEILQWMKDMTDAMATSAYWLGLVEWRDIHSTLNNRIAARKIDLAPDLSEKSIG